MVTLRCSFTLDNSVVNEVIDRPFRMVVFSGGRGAASIARAAVRAPDVRVSLIINGYDDGLSTGLMRQLVPGMLGPSDFRKALSNLCADGPPNKQALAQLLEYRASESELGALAREPQLECVPDLAGLVDQLSVADHRVLNSSIATVFEDSELVDGLLSNSTEMALGNLVLAGAYLRSGNEFNVALNHLNRTFFPSVEVINATDGTNLYLSAIKRSGQILWDEASVVGSQSDEPIAEIFLTTEPLERATTETPTVEQLRSLSVTPEANPRALERIAEADILVYAPGTQHSSLFPTYLTLGLGESVAESRAGSKILVFNLQPDHDIGGESALSLLKKFHTFLCRGDKERFSLGRLVTDVLVTREFLSRSSAIENDELLRRCREGAIRVSIGDWGRGDSTHHGRYVVQVGMTRSTGGLGKSELQEVTVVIPVLNERPRIERVLQGLTRYDWLAAGLLPSFVAVDGGSTDGSLQFLQESFGITVIGSQGGVGGALQAGANAAGHSLWATFPADDEYRVEDLVRVLEVVRQGDAPIAFGSRSGFCVDPRSQLDRIYGGRRIDRVMSYWGGALLSVMATVRHRRSVADPLTSVKAFSPSTRGVLSFTGKDLDWHVRIIREASRGGLAIAEVPVEFSARSRADGKKTRLSHGLRAVVEILRSSS